MADEEKPAPETVDLEREQADTEALVFSAEQSVSAADVTEDKFRERRTSEDRSQIARLIVWVFAGILVLLVLFVIAGTFLTPQSAWKEGALVVKDILNSVMLPVVTLVLGFYFGSEKKG